jgi:hypothetical protein
MGQRYAHFEYSVHALDQMRERKISRRQVERTLNDPDSVYPCHSGRLVPQRHTQACNVIQVVFVEREEQVEIVTAIVITVIRTSRSGRGR